MNLEDIEVLDSPAGRDWLRAFADQTACEAGFALRKQAPPHWPVVAQLQWLDAWQRAAAKLPDWHAAQCLLEPLALEQASSQATAATRFWGLTGAWAVDLTAGLGVDTVQLAQQYQRVTALEPDPLRAELLRRNLRRLGCANVEVWEQKAEDWLRSFGNQPVHSPKPELLYLDPDRRPDAGSRGVALHRIQPDVPALLDTLLGIASRVIVKLSPLFDRQEATRTLQPLRRWQVISRGGECKECVAWIGTETALGPDGAPLPTRREAVVLGKDTSPASLRAAPGTADAPHPLHALMHPAVVRLSSCAPDRPGLLPYRTKAKYLYVPDPAFAQAGLQEALFHHYLHDPRAGLTGPDGYWLADYNLIFFPGRGFRVRETLPWKEWMVRDYLRQNQIMGASIARRNFPEKPETLRRKLRLRESHTDFLFFTQCSDGEFRVYHCTQRPMAASRRYPGQTTI